jgi:signal transduction histidine kinase/ligand-binding sensor domain-containing protein
LTVRDGLSQNAVLAIAQDRRGFLWFATEDGLNKYNGYEFTIYKHDPDDEASLADSFVSTLYLDSAGELWIGTRSGLNRFDSASGTFVREPQNAASSTHLTGKWVISILEDRDGYLWAGTDQWGLNRIDRVAGTVTNFRHDPEDPTSLSNDSIGVIYEDREGELWIGTDVGLNRFDRASGTFVRYPYDPFDERSLGGREVSTIVEDGTGALWIGTEDGGLSRLEPSEGSFTRYTDDPADPSSLCHNRVRALFVDSRSRLWIGTKNGLDLYDQELDQFIHYRYDRGDPYSLSSDAVWSIAEDRAGVLWFGTYGGGVSKHNRTADQFTLYQRNPDRPGSLSDNMVWTLFEDSHGLLWVGTFNGGLNRLDRASNTVTVFRHDPADPRSLSSDDVRDVLEDRHGNLWVATGGGLDRFEPQTETFTHYRSQAGDPNSLSEDRVVVLHEDRAGRLWVGTRTQGLNLFDPTTGVVTRYQNDPDDPNSLVGDRVWSLYDDAEGMLWVGTLSGISVLDPTTGAFNRYQHDPDDPTSLSNDGVFSLYEDPSGTMWIGTWGGGLDRFDRSTGTFSHYTERDGLPNEVIYGIEADAAGFLWMSTNRGLSKFDPRTETFRNYDVRDGLQDDEFNVGAHFASESGELFFGGVQGFNAFHPERVTGNPYVPEIVITAFGKLDERVVTDLASDEEILLSYRDRLIWFEFAALDYTAPDRNQYAYMLEGQDADWVNAGGRRHVDYTNLRGGSYVFHVKGSNNDGVWNEEGVSVTLTVTPPFWDTWWFRILAVVVLAGVVIAGYRLRLAGVEARSRELEKLVAERTAEISRANLLLEQEIAERKRVEDALAEQAAKVAVTAERSRLARELHDAVSQTLFSASLIADVLPRIWESNPEEGARRLEEVRQLSRGALAEMRALLLELRPSALVDADVGDLLRQLGEAAAGRARLPVDVSVEGACSEMTPEVKVAIYRIAQEALNNITKHAGATQAAIRLRCEGASVKLSVRDDGRGFDVENIPPDHLGVGIMRERADAIGASLDISSSVGDGTELTFVWRRDA